jgi:hypothetical protein
MTFWGLQFSKKLTQKFDKFLPYNLKSGPIKKITAYIMLNISVLLISAYLT